MSNPSWQGNLTHLVEPGQVLRASAILTAIFATAGPIFCSGFSEVMVTFTYTRGAVNGAFDWRLEGSIYGLDADAPAGANVWGTEALYASGGLVIGAQTQSRVQTEYETYQEEGAAVESFDYGPIDISGLDRLRLFVRESGVPGALGTLQAQVGMR